MESTTMNADMIKPVLIVSKCLGFDHCRYNGQIIPDPWIDKLKSHVSFRPVCPEVEIGLGVPRDPIRILMDKGKQILFQPATKQDVTDMMNRFISEFLATCDQVDGFLLKNRSPSCGIHDVKIYSGSGQTMPSRKGSGFLGGAVLTRFPDLPVEDEGRLTNFNLREHFFTRIFTLARFRSVKAEQKMAELIEFHTRHKYLLLTYHQSRYRVCGRIVANHEKMNTDQVITRYEEELKRLMKKPPRHEAVINTLEHLFGGISRQLSSQERVFFLKTVEEYRDERIPLSSVNRLIESYAVRFNSQFLLDQIFLNPYPAELVTITDSGKGREF